MRALRITDSCTLWIGRATQPGSIVDPTGGSGFALLLVVGDSEVPSEAQARWAEHIVRAGCRHAVCFGPTSEPWHDSIDWVKVMDEVDGRTGPFVMTSWFDHDPLAEAVDFFAGSTAFDEWIPQHFVVVVLGGDLELEHEVHRALLARFSELGPRGDASGSTDAVPS